MLHCDVRVNYDLFIDAIRLMFRDGDKVLVPKWEAKEQTQGRAYVTDDELLSISQETAQQIFNGLWQAGFRPKDGTGNSGHMSALAYHLEDMRRLVFKDKK